MGNNWITFSKIHFMKTETPSQSIENIVSKLENLRIKEKLKIVSALKLVYA